jgi:hypothetical protein
VREGGREGGREGVLFNANSAIVQLYHGENNIIFNGRTMRFVLY